jgi:hypothetical protein
VTGFETVVRFGIKIYGGWDIFRGLPRCVQSPLLWMALVGYMFSILCFILESFISIRALP